MNEMGSAATRSTQTQTRQTIVHQICGLASSSLSSCWLQEVTHTLKTTMFNYINRTQISHFKKPHKPGVATICSTRRGRRL